jgi:hypothetical protein
MSDQARERKLGDQAGARLYEHQWEIGRGSAPRADGPHPREFDANGFPVQQRNTSFAERVARLLNTL